MKRISPKIIGAFVFGILCCLANARSSFEEVARGFGGAGRLLDLVHHQDGNFYGADDNGIYRITPAGEVSVLTQALPFPTTLSSVDEDHLWGTSISGGKGFLGTIFRIDVETGAVATVATFTGNGGTTRGAGPGRLTSDGADFVWGTTSGGGKSGRGTVFKINTTTGALSTILDFQKSDFLPRGAVVPDGAGFFWGTAWPNGPSSLGSIFKINAATGALTTVVQFSGTGGPKPGNNPEELLLSDGNGWLIGSTSGGGASDRGTIFKVNTSTGELITLVDWTGTGSVPNTLSPGRLAWSGATNSIIGATPIIGGTKVAIYKVDANNGNLAPLSEITGNIDPAGSLFIDDGLNSVLGFSYQGSLFFKVNTTTGATETVIANLGLTSWIRVPSNVISDGAGNLFGVAYPKVVKVNTVTGLVTEVADLPLDGEHSTGARLILNDGAGYMWGVSGRLSNSGPPRGSLFRVNIATGTFSDLATGFVFSPFLTNTGAGTLLGTILNGTAQNAAPRQIFSVDLSTGAFTPGSTIGTGSTAFPGAVSGLLRDSAGFFWGTTAGDSPGPGLGRVFKYDPNTGLISGVVKFTGTTGAAKSTFPASLTRDAAGFIWGVTGRGGKLDQGTVFKIAENSGLLTTVVEFTGRSGLARGTYPRTLEYDGQGFMWGTTSSGSVAGDFGTVFRVSTASGAMTSIVSFTGRTGLAPGAHPIHPLVSDGRGFLWGTTHNGGRSDSAFDDIGGTVFKIHEATGTFIPVFDIADSGVVNRGLFAQDRNPDALLVHEDGNLYGIAGNALGPVIFRIRPKAGPDVDLEGVSGGPVNGEPAGINYATFGVPEVGPFAGTLAVGRTKVPAIFAADGSVRLQVGDTLAGAVVARLGSPAGDAVLVGLKVGTGGVLGTNDDVLLAGLTDGPVRVAAREGQELDSLPGVRIGKIGTFDGNGTTVFLVATLVGTGVTAKTDAALCAALSDGRVRLLV